MFSMLLPKEFNFFDLFDKQVDCALDAAARFKELVTKGTLEDDLIQKVKDAEHRGDDLTHDILDRLSQCDLICFPYGASLESATGAARIALAAGRPLLCSSSTVLRDIQPYGFTLANLNTTTIAEAILVLAGSKELLTIRDEERNRLVNKFSYESVAVQYETILKRISRVKAYA